MARSDYINADGSPRYGVRTGAAQRRQEPAVNVNAVAQELAAMPLIALDLAAKVRRRRSWSVEPDKLTCELLAEYPEQAAEAEAIVADLIGPAREWSRRLESEDVQLAHPTRAQALTGLKNTFAALAINNLPLVVFMVMIAVGAPGFIPLALGLVTIPVALKAGRSFEDRRRAPHQITLGANDRADFLFDAQTATLVALLESRGTFVAPAKAAAARAGFKDMQSAVNAVNLMDVPTSVEALKW